MGPEKVRPGARADRRGRRGAAAAALCRRLLVAGLLLMLPATAFPADAQQLERDEVLAGSGIRYPLGYDPETEGSIEGRVVSVDLPRRGPVVLLLDAGGRSVTVLTSPVWFWDRAEGRPAAGDLVRVTGSKTLGADGELYLVAREIVPAGAACGCLFRDEHGRPLWRGRMRQSPGRRCSPGTGEPLTPRP